MRAPHLRAGAEGSGSSQVRRARAGEASQGPFPLRYGDVGGEHAHGLLCRRHGATAALARLFVLLHGLEAPAIRGVQDRVVRNQVLSYYAQHPNASLRSASRHTKTSVTTIRDPDFQATLQGLQ
jgi:hypothetical protein